MLYQLVSTGSAPSEEDVTWGYRVPGATMQARWNAAAAAAVSACTKATTGCTGGGWHSLSTARGPSSRTSPSPASSGWCWSLAAMDT